MSTLFVWGAFLIGFVAGCVWGARRSPDEIERDKLQAALSISRRIIKDQKAIIEKQRMAQS